MKSFLKSPIKSPTYLELIDFLPRSIVDVDHGEVKVLFLLGLEVLCDVGDGQEDVGAPHVEFRAERNKAL